MATDPESHAPLPLEDTLLMRRVAAADRQAFAQIIQHHQKRVWNVAWRFTRRPEDADDITQDAFLRLWLAAPRWQPTAQLSTWLYRIVANLCLDLQRRQRRSTATLSTATSEPSTTDPALLESQETAARVQHAVAALPERQRLALILHRYEGLSYQQIAQTTGWSAVAIESLLSRAYAQLRTHLQDLKPLT